MIETPNPEEFPENLKFFIFRYKKGKNDYRCGVFAGESKESLYKVTRIKTLPKGTKIEIFEVSKEEFIEMMEDLKVNSTNFICENNFE